MLLDCGSPSTIVGVETFNHFDENTPLLGWYHPQCYFKKLKHQKDGKAIEAPSELVGFGELSSAAQQQVMADWAEAMGGGSGADANAAANAAPKPKKAKVPSQQPQQRQQWQ